MNPSVTRRSALPQVDLSNTPPPDGERMTGCPAAAGESAPECSLPISLPAALDAWRREAVWESFDARGYRCRYFSWGEGPTLVFLHGLSCGPEAFIPAMSRLKSDFRCVAYRLPSIGDACLSSYHLGDLAEDLLHLADRLQPPALSVVGYSMGSLVVLSALARRPERFARAVLVGGFARRPLAFSERLLAAFARYWGPSTVGELPGYLSIYERQHRPFFTNRAAEDWEFLARHDGLTPARTVAHRAMLLARADLRPLLSRIRAHCLLIAGDRDPLVPATLTDELFRLLPLPTRAVFDECGHHPHLSHAETFAEVVRTFLRGVNPDEHG